MRSFGVRVAGWLKHPELDRVVVLLLCRKAWTGAGERAPYFLKPVAVELATGAQRSTG